MIILAIIVLAALVAAYVSEPFWNRAAAPVAAPATPARSGARRKPAATPTPTPDTPAEPADDELELDRAMGRVSAGDFVAPAAAEEDDIERRVRALREQRAKGQERRK